jgi:hypothetical protein
VIARLARFWAGLRQKRQRAVVCRIFVEGSLVRQFEIQGGSGADPLVLSSPIPFPQMGTDQVVRGHFHHEWIDFCACNPQSKERYKCVAALTIEKFGQAIQIKQPFEVEFTR